MELIKKHISEYKRAISMKLSKGKDPIIIAGLGRCGTTLVFNSIIENHLYSGYNGIIQIKDYQGDYLNDVIYKTHDYPPVSLPENVKIIFMFGNPYNTIVSTHRHINLFGELHHKHLGSNKYKLNNDIFYEDTLKLEQLFDAWNKSQNFDFLSLRYESLYDSKSIEILSEFLGFKLKLFPEKERKSNWTRNPKRDQLEKVYGDLFNRIESAENIKIWKKIV